MKNFNDIDFNIEKTTMRELNQHEIHDVAGGTTALTTLTIIPTTITVTTVTITTITFNNEK